MNTMIRITLNTYNQKEIVVLPGHSVQIWKAGEMHGTFKIHEFKHFDSQIFARITQYLQTGTRTWESIDALPTHIIHYIELRNKPFVLIERDDHFNEINGIPVIEQVYLGNTAWQTIVKHKQHIMYTLYM